MFLKIYMLDSHLDLFLISWGGVNDGQGESCHQDMSLMEKRYLGNWCTTMLADYCKDLEEVYQKLNIHEKN